MSKVEQIALPTKEQELPLEGGDTWTFEVQGLTNEEAIGPLEKMEQADKRGDTESAVEGMLELIKKTLDVSTDEDVTIEELRAMPMRYTFGLIDDIMEVNGLEDFMNEAEQDELMGRLR